MKNKLELRGLTKNFRSHWTYLKKGGISDISFSVQEGECFALLGANGAGKTSTIKCILGFIRPESGEILLDGVPLKGHKVRSTIGFLPEQPYFYQHLSVNETLHFYASLFGLRGKEASNKVDFVIERLSLQEKVDERIKSLSKGQQQRVGIAQSILNKPKLLILDEPFSGLDPIARVEIRNLLMDLKSGGTTIMLSSHILSDIEILCDSLVILSKGKLKIETTLNDITDTEDTVYKIIIRGSESFSEEQLMFLINSDLNAMSDSRPNIKRVGPNWIIEIKSHKRSEHILKKLLEKGQIIMEYSRNHRPLEELFVEMSRG